MNLNPILLYLAAAFGLEWFLARRERAWPGLVLPALQFAGSMLAAIGLALYQTPVDGQAASVPAVLLAYNMPTAMLLLLYASCRNTQRRRRQLEKMNIEDLK